MPNIMTIERTYRVFNVVTPEKASLSRKVIWFVDMTKVSREGTTVDVFRASGTYWIRLFAIFL